MYPETIALAPDYPDDPRLFFVFTEVLRSDDAGLTWIELSHPTDPFIARAVGLPPTFAQEDLVIVGSQGQGTYRSTDAGDTWQVIEGGLPADLSTNVVAYSPGFANDRTVYVNSRDRSGPGVFRSFDAGLSWEPAGLAGFGVRTFALSPGFVSDRTILAGTQTNGLFLSTDGGDSWTEANGGLPADEIKVVTSVDLSPRYPQDRTAIAAIVSHGVHKSVDGGLSWIPSGQGLPLDAPRVVRFSPAFVKDRTILHSNHDWLWRSTDAGESWSRLPAWMRVDDNHQSVRYSGDWSLAVVQNGAPPLSFGPGTHVSSAAGDSTSLSLYADEITWYAILSPREGIAEVQLDGQVVAMVDLYAEQPAFQQPVFTRSFPAVGWHTIEVTNTGTANPLSLGTFVHSDGFGRGF
jgi:photosystem II stability/assembly factor-like uncharacterized protein